MAGKRNLITRDDVIKANTAMIQGRPVDFSSLPSSVLAIIRDNKPSTSEMRRAFADARRATARELGSGDSRE